MLDYEAISVLHKVLYTLKDRRDCALSDVRDASWHNNNTPFVGQTVDYKQEDWGIVEKLD